MTLTEPFGAPKQRPGTDPMAAAHLYRLAFGFVHSQMIHVAARLRLPDELARQPLTTEELAARTGTHPPALRRLLRALASIGVVAESGPGTFRLTAVGEALRSDVPGSVRPMLMPYFDEAIWASWGKFLDSVRTGRPSVETVTGRSVFDHFADNPELGAEFHAAMAVSADAEAWSLARSYDFADVGTVVDVGGGSGALLAGLLSHHAHLSGVLVDTPGGVEGAPGRLSAAGVADRCEIVAGDFFASVPVGGDRYVIKSVLHDWDDEQCVAILRTCREAMAEAARILIVEIVAPPVVDTGTDPFLAVSDLNLLILTRGRERTEAEFADLLASAGLRLVGIGDPIGFSGYRVIEACSADAPAQ
ncbi:methyltransferase [Streptomyces avermitilis]|uniref:methyltransferase n=1 Tax=Streptomyces avermitilis TaxID=33903 RepID=UPI00369D5C4E